MRGLGVEHHYFVDQVDICSLTVPPALLLEGWAGCFPVARRDLRAMVLTSVQGYKRSLLSWEVEACMLKFADVGLLKSTAIYLEAIEEMRTPSTQEPAWVSALCLPFPQIRARAA